MAKIKIGEGGISLELKAPKQTPEALKPIAGGFIPEKHVPETSEIVQEVLNHLPRPGAQDAAIDALEGRLESLNRSLTTLSAKQDATQDALKSIRHKESAEKVVVPEVKQVIHHRNHTKELEEHERRIMNLNRVLQKFMKNHENSRKKQKLINLALGAGIALAILSHLL